jgi:hypothetical protein
MELCIRLGYEDARSGTSRMADIKDRRPDLCYWTRESSEKVVGQPVQVS